MRRYISTRADGFTLLEVLVTLTLLALVVGMSFGIFFGGVRSYTGLKERSEELRQLATLHWSLQRKLFGATQLQLSSDSIFMITWGGDYHKGVVKAAFLYKDGTLYYYEFPYPYGDLRFYEEDKLVPLAKFPSLRFFAMVKGKLEDTYTGIPDAIVLDLPDRRIVVSRLIPPAPSPLHSSGRP
ncbi:hypothetical protein Thal_0530 [Thermocrinis albus DSM 14484]|uniref:Prepilin-type N-terminal cleavage/methylation domain-containing protein n=1 Tax=Thermocrinis albus (strain DSM 14484 / JCM 11386 / HI 11/12) TaxID=638303 RepID=D3SPS7_THEAH|nr:prepilin-type N-terminal cleavage/methylation domain-containing protein [Thermocrinis albus]ADC89164.1 hypothetical protein Thal_0530 [Thermocrinis albus DSM 14484]